MKEEKYSDENPEFKDMNPEIMTNGQFDPEKFFGKLSEMWENADKEKYQEILNNKYEGTKLIFITFGSLFAGYTNSTVESSDIALYDLKFVASGYYDIGDSRGGGQVYCGKLTHQQAADLFKKYNIDNSVRDEYNESIFISEMFEYNGWMYSPDDFDSTAIEESEYEIRQAARRYS